MSAQNPTKDLQKEKEAAVRIVLVSHFTRDDIEQLQGTTLYSQNCKNQFDRALISAEKKFKATSEQIYGAEAANNTSVDYWNALEKIVKSISKFEMADLISYADSLEELTNTTEK